MKSGVIGLVSGEMNDFSSFHDTTEQDNSVFHHSVQVKNTDHTSEGKGVVTGQAATQKVEEETSVNIDPDSGEIVVQEEPVTRGEYTQFVAIPDEFVAVKGSTGTFLFDLLSFHYNISGVSRSSINLNEFARQYYSADGVDPWQVGFYGNTGNAEKGTVYGEDVFSDQEIGDVLERSRLNQLGLQYEEDGHIIKITMSESGYVELYQPSNYDAVDFAEYVLENVMEFME